MKFRVGKLLLERVGRSPCGERGLKSGEDIHDSISFASLPVRGAWVEICIIGCCAARSCGRSPCGERGLKWQRNGHLGDGSGRSPCGERGLKSHLMGWKRSGHRCRSPCGERGLKSSVRAHRRGFGGSLPVRGAWVEM